MLDEEQINESSLNNRPNADIYSARFIESKIINYKGLLPQHERNTLAKNMAGIIKSAQSGERKFKKGDVVVKAGVRPGATDAGAVNALNSYCLLPEGKSKRVAKPRLHARPLNYLKLARAAGELAGWPGHKAIMMLTEGSNAFSGSSEIDMEKFTPAKAVWDLLRGKLSLVAKKHQLSKFFYSANELSAEYGYDIASRSLGWRQNLSAFRSTSYWPTVCLASVIRSSAPARLLLDGSEQEVDGEVAGVDEVCLTLGWAPSDGLAAYLEFWPCLAVRPLVWHEDAPWVDFGTWEEVPNEGRFRQGRFRLTDGAAVKMPERHDGNTWPFRSPKTGRFERLNPGLLAETFTDCEVLQTSWQKLNQKLDTSEVTSPPSSPLAWMEAELLGRKSLAFDSDKSKAGFLEELESEIERFLSSFSEWRNGASIKAEMDHRLTLSNIVEEHGALQEHSLKKEIE